MDFKGIIFDLDGTLAFTLEDISDSMNRVLKLSGFKEHSYEEYRNLIGHGIKNLVTNSLPDEHRNNKTIEAAFSDMINDYSENCLIKTKLYDGISEALEYLSGKCVNLAVFSNKSHKLTVKIVNTLIKPGIIDIIIGQQPSIPVKPNPEGALLISRQWDIPANQIAYIGDSGVDMSTANNAGMYAIGVLWGYRDKKDLMDNGAKKIITTPFELLNIF